MSDRETINEFQEWLTCPECGCSGSDRWLTVHMQQTDSNKWDEFSIECPECGAGVVLT